MARESVTLAALPREKGNLGKLRKSGQVPAIYYGPGKPSTMISVPLAQFGKVLEKAGESTIISLKTPSGALDALIHDVEHDPVTGVPVHVDFYLVSKDRKIEVNVPIEFIGIAPAERIGGAVVKVMHELHIEAFPDQLPQHITVDLGLLTDLHSHIAVSNLVLPEGVKALHLPNDTIVGITEQHEEKEEEPVALDLSTIEVEKKGKEEEALGTPESPEEEKKEKK